MLTFFFLICARVFYIFFDFLCKFARNLMYDKITGGVRQFAKNGKLAVYALFRGSRGHLCVFLIGTRKFRDCSGGAVYNDGVAAF